MRSDIPNPAFTHASETDHEIAEKTEAEAKESAQQTPKADEPKKQENVNTIGKYTYATLAIGKGASRYIAIFKKITQGKFIIPSVSAGIFGLAWLIYRRASLYGFMAYTALVCLAYKLITTVDILPKAFQIAIIFSFTHIVFYFIGNFIYWYSVRKKIDNFRAKYGDTSAMTFLGEKGGTITGLNLITVIFLLQGGVLLTVCGFIYIDDFMLSLWTGFLELAHFKG